MLFFAFVSQHDSMSPVVGEGVFGRVQNEKLLVSSHCKRSRSNHPHLEISLHGPTLWIQPGVVLE
jgi:hypothetical protein